MIFNFLGLKFFIFKKIKIKENNMDIYYEDKYEKFVLLTTIITVFFYKNIIYADDTRRWRCICCMGCF